ncbi:hypothetical protein AAHE18_17G166400 [Arachis hypogaea]
MTRRKLEEESPKKIATGGDVAEGDRLQVLPEKIVAEKIVIEGYRHRRRMQKEIAAGEAVAGGDATGEDRPWRRSENATERVSLSGFTFSPDKILRVSWFWAFGLFF